ncbi:prepilin-type N-terminal cleavage/methylation domain-containing protein [Campylobacter concisus]|uniref:Prepilin-type N-terminal cleavage/methylation domain-containing protein n=1 Tax=Campylobacter concisus TaxID=199 RepID=A0A7S9RQ09_9BACT|nr:prepilin-type N-terminal cleavage/methylation domain-containing protein [Campylobacter concisus]QPH95793.1 prepilin-type N-terminal cleavage/methylation domain-containing protein [Campylobacter concisus]
MKKAFTMIELIFVIVIIVILAVVVVTKISATRDDAKLTKVMSEIRVAIQDINTYYISEGKLALDTTNNKVKFKEMTNAGVVDSSGDLGFFAKNERCISLKFFAADQSCLGVDISEQGLCKKLWEAPEFKRFSQTMIKPAQGALPAHIIFSAVRIVF